MVERGHVADRDLRRCRRCDDDVGSLDIHSELCPVPRKRLLFEQFVEPSQVVEAMPKNKKSRPGRTPISVIVHVGLLFNEPPGVAEMRFA
jgi:hypothetical protein